jgi:TRAP-type mannitol/chloroaromatic compound transport system permease small subunit
MVYEPSICMDYATIKKWVTFFIAILCAIVVADVLSKLIVSAVGMSGWIDFLVNFLLYAVFFFAVLYAIEKVFHIDFFGFWKG